MMRPIIIFVSLLCASFIPPCRSLSKPQNVIAVLALTLIGCVGIYWFCYDWWLIKFILVVCSVSVISILWTSEKNYPPR